jgi:seryl-tRNA synthetase
LSLIDQINEDWVQSVKRSAQKLDELLRSRKFPIDSLQEHINEIGQELQKINVQSDAVSKLRAQFQQISEYVNNIDVFSSAV